MLSALPFIALVLAAGPAAAQDDAAAFARGLKPGDRVTVDIAGFKYPATFKKIAPCTRDNGPCAFVDNDDGQQREILFRHLRPATGPSAAQVQAGRKIAPAGKHNCYYYSGMLVNVPGFTLGGGGQFTDHAGSGRWSWDAVTSVLSFSGGAWNGQKLVKTADGTLQVLKPDGSRGAVTCSAAK